MLLGEFLQRCAADFIRHVTNTLQLGDSFDDRHYQTQVARGWLTLGNDAHARFVDGDFHHIDVVIAFDNALRQLAVTVVHCRNRIRKLLLDHAAHGHHRVRMLSSSALNWPEMCLLRLRLSMVSPHALRQINRSGQ